MATTTSTTTTTNLVGSPAGSTTTAAAKKAESLFSTIDSSGRGYLLQADFNTLYAGMAAQQESQHADNSMLQQTSYPSVQPTVFALTQRSVFIADSSVAARSSRHAESPAIANEAVWRTMGWDFWVGYKVWGAIPLTLLFAVANVPMLLRHGLQTEAPVPPQE